MSSFSSIDESCRRRGGSLLRGGKRYRRLILVALGVGITLALLMNGSVAPPYRQLAFLVVAAPLLLSAGVSITQPVTGKALQRVMGCAAVLMIWILMQVAPMPFSGLAHPVWEELSRAEIDAGRFISVSPAQSLSALPALMMPFLVFGAMVLLCQDRSDALFAWKMLAVIGLGLAAASVMLELFFPDTAFFSTLVVGRGAFSGIFVNRNTTAAFLGLVAFATAGWLLVMSTETKRETLNMLDGRNQAGSLWPRFALATLLFILVIMIIMTRSRAGVTLSLIFLTVSVIAFFTLQPDRAQAGMRILRPAHKAGLTALASIAVFGIFGEPVLSRMGAGAEDGRLCVWAATWQMFLDRPLAGTGFATFADVFPRYRDPDCLGTQGVWLQAHNSYLEFVAGTGLIGAAVLLVALSVLIRILITGITTRRSLKPIPIFTAGALAFVALHSIFDFPLQISGVALYFAALLGAGCAVSILTRASGRRRAVPRTTATGERY